MLCSLTRRIIKAERRTTTRPLRVSHIFHVLLNIACRGGWEGRNQLKENTMKNAVFTGGTVTSQTRTNLLGFSWARRGWQCSADIQCLQVLHIPGFAPQKPARHFPCTNSMHSSLPEHRGTEGHSSCVRRAQEGRKHRFSQ